MFEEFKWLPDQASTVAPEVDMLMLFIVVVTVVITALVGALTLGFAIAFRRKSESYIPHLGLVAYHSKLAGLLFLWVFAWLCFLGV